jgi:hypothetical protein
VQKFIFFGDITAKEAVHFCLLRITGRSICDLATVTAASIWNMLEKRKYML